MIAQRYTVVPSSLGGKIPTWKLLDANGRCCGESTDRSLLPDLIAAKQTVAIMVAVCARTGTLVENHARYQCAEDEFNDLLV